MPAPSGTRPDALRNRPQNPAVGLRSATLLIQEFSLANTKVSRQNRVAPLSPFRVRFSRPGLRVGQFQQGSGAGQTGSPGADSEHDLQDVLPGLSSEIRQEEVIRTHSAGRPQGYRRRASEVVGDGRRRVLLSSVVEPHNSLEAPQTYQASTKPPGSLEKLGDYLSSIRA